MPIHPIFYKSERGRLEFSLQQQAELQALLISQKNRHPGYGFQATTKVPVLLRPALKAGMIAFASDVAVSN